MTVQAQPLTLGEILDRTVQLYRRNFLLLAGISAPPAGLMVLFFGGVGAVLASQLPAQIAKAGSNPSANPAAAGGPAALIIGLVVALVLLVGVPLLLGTFALSLGATNYAVFEANRGVKVTIRAAYGFGFRHFWRHVGILFLQGLLAGVVPYAVFIAIFMVGAILAALLGKSGAATALAPLFAVLVVVLLIAMFVVCVWLWLRFSLAFPASVVEDKTSWPSMQRSGKLSKGTRGRIFVMFLLVGVLTGIISMALLIPMFIVIAVVMRKSLVGPTPPAMFFIALQVVYLAVSFLVRAFVMPVYVTSLMLFYYDQRIRQEGYDIEALMIQAGWSELPPPPQPPPAVAEASFASTPVAASEPEVANSQPEASTPEGTNA